MTVEQALRGTAGMLVGASLLLGIFHSPHWFWLTGLIALNLMQSAFTDTCPAKFVFEQIGFTPCVPDPERSE